MFLIKKNYQKCINRKNYKIRKVYFQCHITAWFTHLPEDYVIIQEKLDRQWDWINKTEVLLPIIFNRFIEIHFTYQNIHPLKVYSSMFFFHIFTVMKWSQCNFRTFSACQEDYLLLIKVSDSGKFCYKVQIFIQKRWKWSHLAKKIAPKFMILFPCRHLTSFVSNLAMLVQHPFSNANA